MIGKAADDKAHGEPNCNERLASLIGFYPFLLSWLDKEKARCMM